MRRNVSGKPQSTTVRLTDEGREALAGAPAKLGEGAAISFRGHDLRPVWCVKVLKDFWPVGADDGFVAFPLT